MGRIRGKRNRDQDRYWHERRKQTQAGMVSCSLETTALCWKCKHLAPLSEMHKGWCLPCVCEWVESTDPWLIYQVQTRLPDNAIPKTLMKQMGELEARVVEPIDDYDFMPLMQFMGSRGIAHQRSLWNFLQAIYTFELETSAEATRLGVIYPNTVHLCGRHAPVQRMSIQGVLSRIHSSGADFKPFFRDKHFRDFIRGFVSDNRMALWAYQKTGIDIYQRESQRIVDSKWGKAHFDKHTPVFWPFESKEDGEKREVGQAEELPDVVMRVGELVPTNMPSSLREDLCQDLCVAVLTGEITVEELQIEKRMKWYIQGAFKNHPLRYGRYSLDQPVAQRRYSGNDKDLNNSELVTEDDISVERADRGWLADLCIDLDERPHGWHDGHERERGIASIGDVLRAKHDGHAIDGPNVLVEQDEMDEEIREVYHADSNPQWRRRLSD